METIHLSKKVPTVLYVGMQQEVADWYLFIDEDKVWHLANLTIPQAEVQVWFEKRKDSQNILKGVLEKGSYQTISLKRENEVNVELNFYVKFEANGHLVLTSIEDGKNYHFERL